MRFISLVKPRSGGSGISSFVAVITLSAFFQGFLPAAMASDTADVDELKALSLENLLDLEVVSVSRKRQKLSDTAAAIHVIDQEEIRRSGATSIPELLRRVPGLHVAHLNGNTWSVSSRGFSGRFSNKLLVLIDGRSVYTPLYSGVYWDVQDTILEDIERIEVIRGPGASIWGANAVTGVINIITKSAYETQGNQLKVIAGSEEQGTLSLRHGGHISDSTAYRIYFKGFERDEGALTDGSDAFDGWKGKRAGFRVDSALNNTDDLTLQGQVYETDSEQSVTLGLFAVPDHAEASGGNLQVNWSRTLGQAERYELQAYFDRTSREDGVTFEDRNTFDIDFRHYFPLSQRHQLSWGIGYRYTEDEVGTSPGSTVGFDPESRNDSTWSAFIQDEIALVPRKLTAIIGTKVERNDYTGLEWQPTLRLSWMPDERTSIWGAVSRSLREPSRVEDDFNLVIPRFPVGNMVLGDRDIEAEEQISYELGIRKQFSDDFSMDASIFYNQYDKLRSIEYQGHYLPLTPPYFLPPMIPGMSWTVNSFGNGFDGFTRGVEVSAEWLVNKNWKLSGSYSWLEMDIDRKPGSTDVWSPSVEGTSPEHQLQIHSQWNIAHDWELDISAYFVDRLKSIDVPAYTRLDVRLGWQPRKDLEASLVLQNLLDDRHPEYWADEGLSPTETERGIYGQLIWRF